MEILKRLHAKVLVAGTVSLSLVVALVLIVLNAIVYDNMRDQIYQEVGYITYYAGVLPEESGSEEEIAKAQGLDYDPEYHERMRFFTAYIDPAGRLAEVSLSRIASLTLPGATAIAEQIVAQGDVRGHGTFPKARGYYAFERSPAPGGGELLIVMDCTRERQIMAEFVYFSLLVGIASISLYALLFAYFSTRIMAPFHRNMKSQRQFITNAGHELRTPITIIAANSEVLEMMQGENEWTRTILRQTKRLSDLVDGLLSMAKLEERSEEFQIVDVDASKWAADSVESFKEVAKEGDKSLTAKIEKGLYVKSDSRLFYTLVNTLVDNAIKYCDDGGRIEVTLTRGKRGIELCVANDYANGADVDCTRFFDRFYRADVSHSSEKKGFGIGLSMAEEIVRYSGGIIDVRYDAPCIVFTVTLKAGEG